MKTEVTLTSGVITSPNFPSNYPHNQDNVKYTVRVPQGFNIELTITDINIEQEKNCGYDSLKIYDGQIQLAVSSRVRVENNGSIKMVQLARSPRRSTGIRVASGFEFSVCLSVFCLFSVCSPKIF